MSAISKKVFCLTAQHPRRIESGFYNVGHLRRQLCYSLETKDVLIKSRVAMNATVNYGRHGSLQIPFIT
jgi:hypothetical protein